MTYRVKNWSKFQHYKNRNPPWIRLHVEILDDYKADGTENDFHALPDKDKLTLLLIWALASRYNGVIPSIDPAWLAVKLGIDNPSTDAIIKAGFLVPVSHASTDASTDASNALATQHGDRAPAQPWQHATHRHSQDVMTSHSAVESPANAGSTSQQPHGWSPILSLTHACKGKDKSRIKMDPGFRRDDVVVFLFSTVGCSSPLDDQSSGMITAAPP